jgi:hypothetical protein
MFTISPPDANHIPKNASAPKSERWNCGQVSGNFAEMMPFLCHLGNKSVTWDRRLYFPSEGRHAEDFFRRKIRWLWPGLKPQTWTPEASMPIVL